MDKRQRREEQKEDTNSRSANKTTSLGTLIAWNISKVLEKSPHIDLKCAIQAAQTRLERDVSIVISQCPEERHLECALLAWQQLGHSDADSLFKFYGTKKNEQERKSSMYTNKKNEFSKILCVNSTTKNKEIQKDTTHSKATDSASFSSYSMGPVVKLPVQPKIIMRMDNSGNVRQTCKKTKADENNIMNKIDAMCCLDSECIERLSTLDATTSELRLRAAKLAQREAERAELLERAEAAWKNLELGYHRRLMLAEEKEDDISKQIQKFIEERNSYKAVCTTLVQQLKERGEAAEKERGKLTEVEKSVYDRACVRLRLSEQVAKGESTLAEQHCRGAQVDRDLQFKEEEARRKLRNMESELESTRALTHDSERAMRAELGALKEQVARVSQQLLAEDTESGRIKQELEELQLEKMGIVEDLDGCKVMCENRMQGRMDELRKKKQQLNELNDKVIECRCKFPIDVTVEVKRTPSLAALCHCTPEEKNLESCSCTSLRSQLLSNLLADLFGGLLTELGWTGSQMPCQLLKCLEDKHNWDRASVLKTNLRSFFARLLVGELDIAIATSIEKYHAKWVGATCADVARIIPDTCEAENAGWQERAMERRAQTLATKLAEQLFQDRADQLAQRAKEIVTSGPPPCECKPQSAVYPCILTSPQPTFIARSSQSGEGTSNKWRHDLRDVTQLRLQIESLKKDSIKKADLKIMEENIAKLVERTSVPDSVNVLTTNNAEHTVITSKPFNLFNGASKKKSLFNSLNKENNKIYNMKFQVNKSSKSFNKHNQTFAVNLCLCGTQTGANKKVQHDKRLQDTNLVQNDDKNSWKQKSSNVPISQMPSIKKTKPVNTHLPTTEIGNEKQKKTSTKTICKNDCVCFHKKPSSTSIDKLLETIGKWKNDLTDSLANQDKNYNVIQNSTMSSEKSMKDKRNSKASSKFEQDAENKIIKKIKSNDNDRANEGQIKDPQVLQIIPKATESEYIGAVNLDKSNESLCKCDGDNNDQNNDTCDVQNQCISFTKNSRKVSSAKSNILPGKPLLTKSISSGKDISGSKYKRKNIEYELPLENGKQSQTENDFPTDTSIQSTKRSKNEVLACDCDITLLGVTLTAKKSKKRQKSHAHNDGYRDDDYDTENHCNRKNTHNNNKINKSGRADRTSRKKYSDDFRISCNEPPDCPCQDNFNEMEDFSPSVCYKPKDVFILNIDKGIDVIDTVEGEQKAEACICCNNNDITETKNLEENTFHLLEEHLKEKLDDFKITSCQSSCISPEEENKLFSTLIHKVKQIILDTANNVSCRCFTKPPTEGSWNRAYSLLQEYLKAKMKRVQCHCTLKENVPPLESVLDKVCKLIEQDFDRLKSICKCTNLDHTQGINTAKQILCEEEIPVKDVYNRQADCNLDNDELKITPKPEKVSEFPLNSLKPVILTENISSQVPSNLGMESKSCNVIEKYSMNIQTSEIINGHNEYGSMVSKSHYDCCCDILRKKCYVPVLEFEATEVLVNHCMKLAHEHDANKFPKYAINCKSCSYPGLDPRRYTYTATKNNKNEEMYDGTNVSQNNKNEEVNDGPNPCNENVNANKTTNLPYVGCTIECSCDRNVGACVCIKSVFQANNNKFVDMWKTYTDYNKAHLKNLSYIMKSPSYKPTRINDKVPEERQIVSKSSIELGLQHEVCEVKLSAHGEEGITLKKSRNHIEDVHSAGCELTDSFNAGRDCLIGSNSSDWCECSSRPLNVSNIDEDDKITCSRDSSDIFGGELGDNVAMNQLPKNCNCDVVPICHVKMLVESIENKLIQSRCTCDSLVSIVCPIHSARLT